MSAAEAPVRVALQLTITGRVQGVGFRPLVYRLARHFGLSGWVRNEGDGVTVSVEGDPVAVEAFQNTLSAAPPPQANIETICTHALEPEGLSGFAIRPSRTSGTGIPRVPQDRATCADCLQEVEDPTNRRHLHPFANCTECGPRYTILRSLPYDRARTTMADFPLCVACQSEYESPVDRRFHAQPVACPHCGPRLRLEPEGLVHEAARRTAVAHLRAGRIVAVKGLGGFQLAVRARDAEAVRRLRERKRRPRKPLAVMVANLAEAERLAVLGPEEREQLARSENPIVLVSRSPTSDLPDAVAPGMTTVGLFLPTTALHHILLREAGEPLVVTSGNVSEEPIAREECDLGEVAEAILTHDRPILRRADDSVIQVIGGRPCTLRLGRGLAPLPLPHLEAWARRRGPRAPILAVGGQQKVATALWTESQAILGPHLGDLDHAATEAAFIEMTRALPELYRCTPALVAADRHPEYVSSRWAETCGLPVRHVQHHHAHAAALIAEHGLFDGPVLAFTWDGTGLGEDGILWGGEALLATLNGYERLASLRPFPLVGSERAIREPGRIGLVLVAEAEGRERVRTEGEWAERLGLPQARAVDLLHLAERGLHAPLTTSVGRLFDGIASLLGWTGEVSYEGEAAVWLEGQADSAAEDAYPLPEGDWRPLVRAVVADLRAGVDRGRMAARVHQGLARWAGNIAARTPEVPVVLGGGCFQNRRLTEGVVRELESAGRRVYLAEQVPTNDGGLAVGQLAIALADAEGA